MSEPVFQPWGESERQIYRFHDGTRERRVDPIVILRRLNAVPGLALDDDLALAAVSDKGPEYAVEAEKATARLVAAARAAFGLPTPADPESVDVEGLTESECLMLLTHFGNYLGGLAESSRPLSSGEPPSGSAPSADSSTPPLSEPG